MKEQKFTIIIVLFTVLFSCSILLNFVALNGLGDKLYSTISQFANSVESMNQSYQSSLSKLVTTETIDIASAATYLGITKDSLMRVISDKSSKIPYVYIDYNYLFTRKALDEWLATSQYTNQ